MATNIWNFIKSKAQHQEQGGKPKPAKDLFTYKKVGIFVTKSLFVLESHTRKINIDDESLLLLIITKSCQLSTDIA